MKKTMLVTLLFISIGLLADGTPPTGIGTSGDPYQIATLDNLLWVSTSDTTWSSHFIQTADIDASATSTWNGGEGFIPIGYNTAYFTGTYNGQGHTIDGLYINRPSSDSQGLFGFCNSATVENLGVTNVDVSGDVVIGGLVGRNSNSTISNCYSTGSVNGFDNYTGGLVGCNYNSEVNNSFWDTETSGQSWSDGGTGKTTAEMQTQSTFTDAGWDFIFETANGTDDIWFLFINFNNGYPGFACNVEILAYFEPDETDVFIGTEIQFTDISFGSPTQWQWDFENDGTYDSTEQNPIYTYPTTGVYSVKLTVSDGINTDSYIRTDYIYVNNTPAVPQNVQINLSGDDAIISWDAVTHDIDGVPINLDGYIVKFSEDNDDFFFHGFTDQNFYTHNYVVVHSPQMFYHVLAYKSYSTRQLEYLKELNNSAEKLKWSEVKRNLERIE
ncbi:MAG: PKD domain-containing protein [Candidatus Delongbacteria bacterium]|nr:PKD domain-containing protein [Candidatus Delongbacteria bacterium]